MLVAGLLCAMASSRKLLIADPTPAERQLRGEAAQQAKQLEVRIAITRFGGKFAEAETAARQLAELRAKHQGVDHWEVADANRLAADCRHLAGSPASVHAEVARALQLGQASGLLQRKARYAEAEPIAREVLDICQRVHGNEHHATARALQNLGLLLSLQGNSSAAEPLFQQALAVQRRVLGDEHPDSMRTYINLCANLEGQGKYAAAEPLARQAMRLSRHLQGEEHIDTLNACLAVAILLDRQGKFAAAEPFHRFGVALALRMLGENHHETAAGLNSLGANLSEQGKHREATGFYERSLAIKLRIHGEDHESTGKSYQNLALNRHELGDSQPAESLARKALDIRRRTLGPEHPDTQTSASNLALILSAQRRLDEAEVLSRQVLNWRRQNMCEDHPDTATAFNNLGHVLAGARRHAEAEQAHRQALAIKRRVLGPDHPSTGRSLNHVAICLANQGQHAEALRLWQEAVQVYEAARLRVSVRALDRAAFGAQESPYDALAGAFARADQPERAWQALEADLARGLIDEASARRGKPLDPAERERREALSQKLDTIQFQLFELVARKDSTKANREKLEELIAVREKVEQELGKVAVADSRSELAPLTRIQSALPMDAALIAWLDLRDRSGDLEEHWACVVKKTGPPNWVQLPGRGSKRRWTDEDWGLTGQARAELATPDPLSERSRGSLQQLFRQRFGPLEPHLPGVKRLLVCPAGQMAGIPVEALTDRYVVSYVPSGSVFTRLVEQRPPALAPRALLVVGDPAYLPAEQRGAGESVAVIRGAALSPLPGSRREVHALSSLFPHATILLGPDASEQRLRDLVQRDQLRHFQYLHFATHGTADDLRLLQNALLLSQDQLPRPGEELLAGRQPIDGKLTAEEILETWKLQAELVVLSACQTALGTQGGGDGYIGFSQVLLLAGARSVVLSLWQVSDSATALLMVRFYENLLGKRAGLDKRMPKAEALQEAKHWLRNLTRVEAEKRIAGLPEAARGLKLVPPAGIDPAARDPVARVDKPFEHPFYWSAFILIGDSE
jgi:CHAT domain-containing protein/tetratricopeptide (TPR) repeat protein